MGKGKREEGNIVNMDMEVEASDWGDGPLTEQETWKKKQISRVRGCVSLEHAEWSHRRDIKSS